MENAKFNDPVFVRVDDTTTIKASVVEWNDSDLGRMSVLLSNGNESVLVSADDWATLVGCVNRELDRRS
jgi:hypothetical protein